MFGKNLVPVGVRALKTVAENQQLTRTSTAALGAVMNYTVPEPGASNDKNSHFPPATSYPIQATSYRISTKYNTGGALGHTSPIKPLHITQPSFPNPKNQDSLLSTLYPPLSSFSFNLPATAPVPLTISETLISQHQQFQDKLTTIVNRIDEASDINQLLNHFLH